MLNKRQSADAQTDSCEQMPSGSHVQIRVAQPSFQEYTRLIAVSCKPSFTEIWPRDLF